MIPWLYSVIILGGCTPETLVATPSHFDIARMLHTHDRLPCRTDDGATITRSIEMVKHRRVDEVIHLKFGDDELDVATDQRFLIADEARFITADQLTIDHRLVNINGCPVVIDHIERRYGTYLLITLSVNEYHTFFVTKQGIVLHNNLTFSFITIPERFEAPAKVALTGAAGLIAIPVGTPVAGAIIACGFVYHMKDHITNACRAIGRGFTWLFSTSMSIGDEARKYLKQNAKPHEAREIDQMADPEPNDDGTYRVYQPSPKHYPNPWRDASPGPGWISGQIALNLSWQVITDSGHTETRVAYWNGKIVIFQFTQQIGKLMIYHGYYQNESKISDLDIDIRKILRKYLIINHKDKIIK